MKTHHYTSFDDPGCISPAAALPGIIDEYIEKFRVVRY